MGLAERFRARRERQAENYLARVEAFVAPVLDDGEAVVAMSGGAPRPPVQPIRGRIVVVTDRRVLIVAMSWWDRPKVVESVHPRDAVQVIEHRKKSGFLYVAFRMDDSSLSLYFKPWYASRAAAVVAALGGPPLSPLD
jgi:hypothetical protein